MTARSQGCGDETELSVCGHSVDLHRDYDDYEGQVKCFVCGAC